jgi:hypothetical protein
VVSIPASCCRGLWFDSLHETGYSDWGISSFSLSPPGKYWNSTLKQTTVFVIQSSPIRCYIIDAVGKDQLRWVVGLLTGHCHLKEHLWKLGLTDDPTCERCLQEDESATHILCDCEAIAHLRFHHLGQFFMEPSDFFDAPIFKVLHFIRSVGLIRG